MSEIIQWKRDMVALAFSAIAMFFVDFVLGIELADAFHTGPLGITWLWTPGSTVVYVTFAVLLLRFIRQESVEAKI